MPTSYKSRNKRKPKPYKEWPAFEVGAAGDRFQPSTFGTDRGTEETWVSKMPAPPAKMKKG